MIGVFHFRVREALEELSNIEFQQRVWVEGKGPEVSSFIEAVEGLFTDSGLSYALDKGMDTYGSHVDSLLREIDLLVSKIDSFEPDSVIIKDLRFIKVRKLAGEILQDPEFQRIANEGS